MDIVMTRRRCDTAPHHPRLRAEPARRVVAVTPDDVDQGQTPAAQAIVTNALSSEFSSAAIQCIEAYMAQEREAVVQSSVSYLLALCDVWKVRDVDNLDVWREVDGRMQVSALLKRLNQRRSSSARIKRGMWHPSSTKLP